MQTISTGFLIVYKYIYIKKKRTGWAEAASHGTKASDATEHPDLSTNGCH